MIFLLNVTVYVACGVLQSSDRCPHLSSLSRSRRAMRDRNATDGEATETRVHATRRPRRTTAAISALSQRYLRANDSTRAVSVCDDTSPMHVAAFPPFFLEMRWRAVARIPSRET